MNKKFVFMVLLGCSVAFFNSIYPNVKRKSTKLFGKAFALIKEEKPEEFREFLKKRHTPFTNFEWHCMLWIARNNTALCDVIYEANPRSILCEHNTKFYGHYRKPFLYMAVSEGNNQFVAWLLAHGAGDNGRIDVRCFSTGKTALHVAFEDENMECVQLLLRYGARMDIPDNTGKTVQGLYSEESYYWSTTESRSVASSASSSKDSEPDLLVSIPKKFEDTLLPLPYVWEYEAPGDSATRWVSRKPLLEKGKPI